VRYSAVFVLASKCENGAVKIRRLERRVADLLVLVFIEEDFDVCFFGAQ